MLTTIRALVIVLCLSLSSPVQAMHLDPGSPIPDRDIPGERLPAQTIWSHVVQGESGGAYMPASLLVAWTLRAWEVERGMPAAAAGPRWGWHGWAAEPGFEAREAVAAAWGKPLSVSPFEWMRDGNYCFALGSKRDGHAWAEQGLFGSVDFVLDYPDGKHAMWCYWPDD